MFFWQQERELESGVLNYPETKIHTSPTPAYYTESKEYFENQLRTCPHVTQEPTKCQAPRSWAYIFMSCLT